MELNREIKIPNVLFDNNNNKILQDMGIGSFEITENYIDTCSKKYKIAFYVVDGWNIKTLKVVQIVYSPCDKNAARVYHNSDGYQQN